MIKLKAFFLVLMVLALWPNSIRAGILNGSFETGSYSPWNSLSGSFVTTDIIVLTPTDGMYQSISHSAFGPDGNALAAFVGTSLAQLELLTTAPIFGGSAIKQTFSTTSVTRTLAIGVADVGDGSFNSGLVIDNVVYDELTSSLQFDWNFLSDDSSPISDFNDFAFVSLDDTQYLLADLLNTPMDDISVAGFQRQSGWNHFQVVSVPSGPGPGPGPGPGAGPTVVPEPTTWVISLCGLALSAMRFRNKRFRV